MAGLITIDSPVRHLAPAELEQRAARASRREPHYSTRAELLQHFHIAHDAAAPTYVLDHIAATSARHDKVGWTWKADPRVFADTHLTPTALSAIRCPYALCRAEHGLVSEQMAAQICELTGGHAAVTTIANCGHHIPLERPLQLADHLRDVASRWVGAEG